jgi:hypothetical protein
MSVIRLDHPSLLAALRGEQRSRGLGLVCARPDCPQAGHLLLVQNSAREVGEPHRNCLTLETGELSSLPGAARLHQAMLQWLRATDVLPGERRTHLIEQLDEVGWAALSELSSLHKRPAGHQHRFPHRRLPLRYSFTCTGRRPARHHAWVPVQRRPVGYRVKEVAHASIPCLSP